LRLVSRQRTPAPDSARRGDGGCLKYYLGWQFIPMKGNAAMYYETDEAGAVKRFMTVIESTGEIEKMSNPPMKRLFRPELLEEVSAADFEKWWTAE
jgi:hypothetical protein